MMLAAGVGVVSVTGVLAARCITTKRLESRIHELMSRSPVLEASRLRLPPAGEWSWAGELLVEHLRGHDGVTNLLLERVYQLYLPVFFWIKEFLVHLNARHNVQDLAAFPSTQHPT